MPPNNASVPSLDQIIGDVHACLSIIAPGVSDDLDLTDAFIAAAKAFKANPGSPDQIADFLDRLRMKYPAPWSLGPGDLVNPSPFATDTVTKIAKRIRSVY